MLVFIFLHQYLLGQVMVNSKSGNIDEKESNQPKSAPLKAQGIWAASINTDGSIRGQRCIHSKARVVPSSNQKVHLNI